LDLDNNILINEKNFNDFDLYSENMLKWNLELFQIKGGKFQGSLRQAVLPNIIIQYYRTNKGLKLKGSAPQGYNNFSIVLNGESAPIWRGKELNHGTIAVLPENGELEGITPDGFETLELAVSKSYMENVKKYLGLDEILDIPAKDKIFNCDKTLLDKLKLLLLNSQSMLNNGSAISSNSNFINELEHYTAAALIRSFSPPKTTDKYKQSDARRKAIKRIEDITEQKNDEQLTVAELCHYANVSLRTLEYAFREKYDLSPKQYLRTVRLNKVHKLLLKSSPRDVNISDVANKFGFWHMGQFAKDYQNLFGELPSETLNKAY
jgi:AraC family ethanolamine operon transcriptional activator